MYCIDVCSGGGGLSLGLRQAGFAVIGVEHNPIAVQTQTRNGLNCVLSDIHNYHPHEGYPVHLVAGGVPCQPHTLSRVDRKGTETDNGRLHLQLLRIAQEVGADCILIENVKGLRTAPSARGYDTALEEVKADIRSAGYPWLTDGVLNAARFAVPQRRERLFLFACKDRGVWNKFRLPYGQMCEVTVAEALEKTGLVSPTQETALRAIGLWDTRACTTISTKNRITAPGWRTEKSSQFKGSVAISSEIAQVLQGFPLAYEFSGGLTARRVQIGNAVPPALAEAVGRAILRALS